VAAQQQQDFTRKSIHAHHGTKPHRICMLPC
jgi:hypothetical protein